jgi:hypothetical protein
MQADRDQFEAFVWHALGAVAGVCGGCTRLQIMGNAKTQPIVLARSVFIWLMQATVAVNRKRDCWIDLAGSRPDKYRPITFLLMSRIFGHCHSTYVLLNQRAHKKRKLISPLVEQAKAKLVETWGTVEAGR